MKSIHSIKSPKSLEKIINSLEEDELFKFLNEIDYDGNNALFTANAGITNILIKYLDINIQNNKGETALFNCNLKKAEILLKNGISVNFKDSNGNTALFKSDIETTRLLLKNGANTNSLNNKGQTAIFHANLEKAKILIEHGANPHIADKDNANVLFYACMNDKDIERASFYLSINVDFNLKISNTPFLFFLSQFNRYEHIALLIQNNINIFQTSQINIGGQTKKQFFFESSLNFNINKLCSLLDIPQISESDNQNSEKIIYHIDNFVFKREREALIKNLQAMELNSEIYKVKKRI